MKVTIPAADEAPEAEETVSLAPRDEERVTVFPEIGLELASSTVIVIVAAFDPFAGNVPALLTTVETVWLTTPGE